MAYNDGSYIQSRIIARWMVVGPTKIGAAGCWEWQVQQQHNIVRVAQLCCIGRTLCRKKYILSNGENGRGWKNSSPGERVTLLFTAKRAKILV